ncbi:uncharacterized protein I206_100924 [Kwoniella pini CBS 10737]|uniref:Uncharacterized protein n=1 Tax=Kwoniella pini CBS 10737 TaxID=1296096 RepID=A0A1B9ICI2_9TREE|nr:uncharacterized protein I206_00402 [Kwoniella pini CBS 10737]OCF53101.1 hypothetical protein I206_00402 [Kwoniella pini CBS 10737]
MSRPLPVERSQGSVSALVARFQTAANRDVEATARENRRASLQSSSSRRTSSNLGGSGIGISSSSSNTPQINTANLPNSSEKETQNENSKQDEKKDKSVEAKEQGVVGKSLDMAESVENKFENLIIGDEKRDASLVNNEGSDSPSRPPKSPKRVSSSNVMSTLPIPDAPKDVQIEPSVKNKLGSEKQVESSKSNINGKEKDVTTPTKSTPSKTQNLPPTAPAIYKPSPMKPTTTTMPVNPKPRTRLSSGPSSTPSRSRTSLDHQTPPTSPASTKTPSSTTSTKPLVSGPTSTPKPLVPTHTGPARRPTSSAQSHGTPSPLKPQLTGTPNKPTASSLAKARIPSGSLNTPSSDTNSTKRESLSLGKNTGAKARSSIGRDSLSPSPGPNSSGPKSTGSRLLQGTAASRAKAAGVQHNNSPATSPSTTKTLPKTPTTISSSNKSQVSSSQSRTQSSQARIKTPSSTSTSRVRSKSQNQPNENETPSKDNILKTPAVGKSPIGRIGLAAANLKRPENLTTKNENKTKKQDEITDKKSKEELQELTDPLKSLDGRDKQISDIVERPKTPSPEENGQDVEKVTSETNDVSGLERNIKKMDVQTQEANGYQDEVEKQKEEKAIMETGEESLEEIPDIE